MRGARAGRHAVGRGVLALRAGRPRALVLRALGLGDLLTAVPALRVLRERLPGHEIVLAAPAVLAPLVALADAVDRVLGTAALEPVPWEGPPPEVAVNLHGRGPQSHQVLQALSPGRLVAFGCVEAGHDGSVWRADEHEVARWLRLVGGETRRTVEQLRLRRPDVAPPVEDAVVVHPGAAFGSRRWPAERFAAVARALAADGHRVVVTGGPEEVALAESVRRSARLPADAVLAGRTDLMQLAAVVAAARLVVCGDTGVAHLASAFGTPSVVLFGPVDPALWGPPADGPHTVLWHGDGAGDPWGDEPDPALLRIHHKEVWRCATRGTAPR